MGHGDPSSDDGHNVDVVVVVVGGDDGDAQNDDEEWKRLVVVIVVTVTRDECKGLTRPPFPHPSLSPALPSLPVFLLPTAQRGGRQVYRLHFGQLLRRR